MTDFLALLKTLLLSLWSRNIINSGHFINMNKDFFKTCFLKNHFFRLTQKYKIEEFWYSNYLLLDRTHHFFYVEISTHYMDLLLCSNCSKLQQWMTIALFTFKYYNCFKIHKKVPKKSWNQLWPKKLIDFISWGNDATSKIALFSILAHCEMD